ncbi:hypothetical protein HDV57DRAFT_489411 [Trichoderma longibrachiatum]|uniref:Uncharacterized protein n=1 Tax=Trichoderma longibrachiatum ATCC 18648 TaxID=983965 RepID=A0A2T4BXS2_TRILO|nr:hypothetical protein M440DRAFT_1338751 [Trichoderma longibrachiatum ATCC 18648]
MPGTTNLDVIQAVPRVATLIYQTHQLWQEIREVPEGIQGLVDHLKALEPIFADIEDQFNQDETSTPFKNCLDLSRKAHDSLGALVADMRTQLQANRRLRRKYAAVKIVLNKTVLTRLEQSLSRCMNFLQLAIQAYQMAMLRKLSSNTQALAARVQPQHHTRASRPLSPQLQLEEKMPQKQIEQTEWDHYLHALENAAARSRATTEFTLELAQYVKFKLAHTKSTGAWQARLQMPKWLSTSVYEVMSSPAIAGWTYTYRVYNVIPDNSEIIQKIHDGDVVGVRQMFSSKAASPFDRSQGGESLLHYAASSRRYEICQLLLKLGLQPLLDTRGYDTSPVESIANDMVRTRVQKWTWPVGRDPKRIADLFASYLQQPDSLPAERLLDFIREFAPDDLMVSNFRALFMPNYYLRMLRDRLEAVRLGAFNVLDVKTFGSLLSEDRTFSEEDVHQSTREKVSLVHSAALAFGCRYPEELVRYPKLRPWLNAYDEDWGDIVTRVASVATLEDLTSVETVVPWDAYEVTAWEGTPLMSLIGGTLCYLCPRISYNHWHELFHGCLHKWLLLLQSGGVDLLAYGKREASILHSIGKNTKGAFDADAIEASRTMLRHPMTRSTPKAKLYHMGRKKGQMVSINRSGEQYWIPFRMIDIAYGPSPSDWKLIWAPEFENMARQFWELIEAEEAVMPGTWLDW